MPARPPSSRLPALGAILGLALVRLVTRRGGTPAHHGPARAEPHAGSQRESRRTQLLHRTKPAGSRVVDEKRHHPPRSPPGAGRTSSGASTTRSTRTVS